MKVASAVKVYWTPCPGRLKLPLPKTKIKGKKKKWISLPPHGKKRTAPEGLEVEAPKRGKISLSDGSGSEDDVDTKLLFRDKPFVDS